MTKLEELISDIEKAEILASEYSGGYSGEFLSVEEFHRSLKDSLENLKNGELEDLDNLQLWFSPTGPWDDFIGLDGLVLGNQIFEKLNSLK